MLIAVKEKAEGERIPPFAPSAISLAGWVTHHCFNASLSGGTPCCPYTSPPITDRDEYRCDNDIRITLLEVKKRKGTPGEMAEAAQLAWCGLN